MEKIGNNDRCPCGSGKKYKKCCRDKKPRQHTVMIGSPVPLKGLDYNRETMTFEGIAHNGQLVKPAVTFSQTSYIGESGKEKVLTRTHDKVIPNQADLIIHLSSFDTIIAVDTNSKKVGADQLSVSGIVLCRVRPVKEDNSYAVNVLLHCTVPFRNCPLGLSPEIFGWILTINKFCREPTNAKRKYCLVSDYDLNNHGQYNNRSLPIYKNIYLPSNVVFMYGKGDSSKENILNNLIMLCDKEASRVIKEMEETGFYKCQDKNISISQIPIPIV
jgi:hypothetical protein